MALIVQARVGFGLGFRVYCASRELWKGGTTQTYAGQFICTFISVRSRAVQYLALGAGGPKLPEYSLLYVDIKADGTRSKTSWEPVDAEIQKDRDEV